MDRRLQNKGLEVTSLDAPNLIPDVRASRGLTEPSRKEATLNING